MNTISEIKSKTMYRGIKSKQSTSLDFIRLIGGEDSFNKAYNNGTIYYVNNIISDIAMSAIQSVTGVTRDNLKSKLRFKEESSARHVYAYLMNKYSSMTLKFISEKINRDHSTIINSIEVCSDKGLLKFNEELYSIRESCEKAFLSLYKSCDKETKMSIIESIRSEISRLKDINQKLSSIDGQIDVARIVENLIN